MSRLKDRLKRLATQPSQPTLSAESSKQLKDEPTKQVQDHERWLSLGAVIEENEWGTFVRRVRRFSLNRKHGHYELGQLQQEASFLSRLDAKGVPVSSEGLLFFDTETTGLGVGAGNVPFMFGFGYYETDVFVVEQFLMRHPGEEPAMLAHCNELIQKYTHLISYNGRTFDWPVVKNRFVLHRMPFDDAHLSQLDFLYPARNLWKTVLSSCSLGRVEEERLGVHRIDDIPGAIAPTYYFQYLSSGDPHILDGVFNHNEWDILTLAGLAAHFAGVLRGRLELTGMEPEEMLRLGRWLDKVGEVALAERVYSELYKKPPALIQQQLLPLASIYKKKGRYPEAVSLWKSAIAGNDEQDRRAWLQPLEPFIELAMYYEHHAKQLDHALDYATQAREITLKRLSLGRRAQSSRSREMLAALDKRIQRLTTKIQKRNQSEIDDLTAGGDLFSWSQG